MTQRLPWWGFVLLPIFILTLTATGFFAWQLRRAQPPSPANFLAAPKGYGVTIDLTRYSSAEREATLASLRDHGLTWLRQPVRWADLEPAPGQFDWQSLDRVVEAVDHSASDFELIAVLQTTPAWARPANTPLTTPPVEVHDFGRFARAFADRYGHQIDYYQIWHEPNLSANWGDAFVNPVAYADLLREAALTIRAADLEASLLTAALAPTLENGPLNLNEPAYLDQLYQARADRWFDIVAVQPYGFDSEPTDPARAEALNFRRAELVRQVMLAHNDPETPLWATAFGWNALPADWAGQPSPWKSDTPAAQARRTAAAIELARQTWPWLGPMLALRWDPAGLAADDPARGFALLENQPVLAALQAAATAPPLATPGRYPADHPTGRYSQGWRFARTRADIPHDEPRTLTIPIEGTRLDVTVFRGLFRGYLWVTIDGQPANALPQDGRGRSYVVLYDPQREAETVTLAHNLPQGRHRAVLQAEGGWSQWAIGGWTVYDTEADLGFLQTGLAVAGVLLGLCTVGLAGWFLSAPTTATKLVWAWGEVSVALYAILGETGQILATFGLAIGFYLLPGPPALLLLPVLGLIILLRPDLGLALIAFSLSFFQAAKQLPIGNFSPVELALALTTLGVIFRLLLTLARATYASVNPFTTFHVPIPQAILPTFYALLPAVKSLDWAALVLVLLALLSTLAADNFGVSMREWRVVVFESVLFYVLVRLGLDYNPGRSADPRRYWAWRLADALVAGAILQALIALYLYLFTDQSITAEGVRRALGLAYGSPNNLSLFLDRIWPLLLAVVLLASPKMKVRRWLYGFGLAIVSLALYLTFSKGALLLGLPASVVAMAFFYSQRSPRRQWRRVVMALIAGLIIIVLAVIPLAQTARFRTIFDLNQGSTGFFRLKLWQASLAMLEDHWPLGVGLDNFLYQYRTRYILPEAWQEPNLSHPHNLFLDFGTRLGLGGIVLLFWLQGAFWLTAWRLYQKRPTPLVLGLMGSMVVFLAHGLVDNAYFLVDLAFIFFLTAGIVQRLEELADR